MPLPVFKVRPSWFLGGGMLAATSEAPNVLHAELLHAGAKGEDAREAVAAGADRNGERTALVVRRRKIVETSGCRI